MDRPCSRGRRLTRTVQPRRPRSGGRLRAAAVALLVVLAVSACVLDPNTPAPSERPSGSPRPSPELGIDWGRSAPVERPDEAFVRATPTPGPTERSDIVRSGHPLHFPGQAIMADVEGSPDGGFVSVGYVYPGWRPVAWTSADAVTWSLSRMGTTEFTFPVALAVRGSTIVAVGRSGTRPLAWSSADGRTWQEHDVPTLGTNGVAERMTTVIATPFGFLAGGSVGPELFERHARFWISADGNTWQPVADDDTAFANAEVRSIVPWETGFVAVGVLGSGQRPTGSVAWTSPDGQHWTRIDAPDLLLGRAVALVTAPFGGLVAVGADLNEHEAFVWLSEDGSSWRLVPGEASRQYHGKVRMTDVVAVGSHLVAIGNYVGLQRGTATSWVSDDGLHWRRSRDAPVLEQGEPYAVTTGGPGLIAVGSFGAPDDYIPTVWLSPSN